MSNATKERILNAATELFGRHGFDNVSVREITKHAGVNLSALSYHYVDKEGLVDAVVDTQVTSLNRTRQNLLKKAELDFAGSPPFEKIMEAFLAPAFIPEIHQSSPYVIGALNAKTLIIDSKNNPYRHPVFVETISMFLQALQQLFPSNPKAELRSLLRIASGSAMALRSFSYNEEGPIDIESSSLSHVHQLNSLICFIKAGFLSSVIPRTSDAAS